MVRKSDPCTASGAESAEIPCIFPLNREYAFRDGFAEDCFHRQLVLCFYGEISSSEIIAYYPPVRLTKLGTKVRRERISETAAALRRRILCSPIGRSGWSAPSMPVSCYCVPRSMAICVAALTSESG